MPSQPRPRPTPRHRIVRSGGMKAPTAIDLCARAVDAFRRGAVVRIESLGQTFLTLAVETASDRSLQAIKAPSGAPLLLLTHARARTLKIRTYTPEIVAVRPEVPLRASRLLALADPTADLAEPLKGPFDTVREPLDPGFAAAVKLAKLAGLLPAAIVWRAFPSKVPSRRNLSRFGRAMAARNIMRSSLVRPRRTARS